jgi:hypothetical protein
MVRVTNLKPNLLQKNISAFFVEDGPMGQQCNELLAPFKPALFQKKRASASVYTTNLSN